MSVSPCTAAAEGRCASEARKSRPLLTPNSSKRLSIFCSRSSERCPTAKRGRFPRAGFKRLVGCEKNLLREVFDLLPVMESSSQTSVKGKRILPDQGSVKIHLDLQDSADVFLLLFRSHFRTSRWHAQKSSQHSVHHLPKIVGEPEIPAVVPVGKPGMVKPH